MIPAVYVDADECVDQTARAATIRILDWIGRRIAIMPAGFMAGFNYHKTGRQPPLPFDRSFLTYSASKERNTKTKTTGGHHG
jgi:hypothetical protein